MIRSALRYFGRAPQLAQYLANDPVEVFLRLRAKFAERNEERGSLSAYCVDRNWERSVHEAIGRPWPCQAVSEFWSLWPEVISGLTAKRLKVGVGAFGGFNDGEPEMVRAVYCLARHLRPVKVVETGVARGVTSRVILEALERNGAGHLWSIDLPPLLYPELAAEVGAAVEERNRHRWSYIKGSSRRCLPGLLNALGAIDLFVHDSIHTEYNTRFELDSAWRALSLGGAVVVDDIDLNPAFHAFVRSPHVSFVCAAKPLQPDPSRYDDKGLFGIVLKNVGHAR